MEPWEAAGEPGCAQAAGALVALRHSFALSPQHRLEEEKQCPVAQVWAWLTPPRERSPGAGTPLCLQPPPPGARGSSPGCGPCVSRARLCAPGGQVYRSATVCRAGSQGCGGTRQAQAPSGLRIPGMPWVQAQAGGAGECGAE